MKFTQPELVSILKKSKDVYPHKVSKIQINETHISWIFLTGKYAYKMKKALKFGKVLDFSTLQLRKKFCEKEVKLNKVLCNEMYRGVVKVVKQNSNLKIINPQHSGKALEYAVKMIEIPQKYRMDKLVDTKKVNFKTIDKLTTILDNFHRYTPTGVKIKRFGQPKYMQKKVQENFRTLETLSKVNPKYEKKLLLFIKNNTKLFERRIKNKKIRDIHGDLYLKNIFIVKNRFYLYDRLEFNDSLRYADVAEDVAHLAMDFDFHKRKDLRRHFISQYLEKSNDFDLKNLVYFLMCFKACVRGKVSLFQAKNEPIQKKRNVFLKESKRHFKLADSYLKSF
jgi:aminoglycoside phosphotransferase family enzyme